MSKTRFVSLDSVEATEILCAAFVNINLFINVNVV